MMGTCFCNTYDPCVAFYVNVCRQQGQMQRSLSSLNSWSQAEQMLMNVQIRAMLSCRKWLRSFRITSLYLYWGQVLANRLWSDHVWIHPNIHHSYTLYFLCIPFVWGCYSYTLLYVEVQHMLILHICASYCTCGQSQLEQGSTCNMHWL